MAMAEVNVKSTCEHNPLMYQMAHLDYHEDEQESHGLTLTQTLTSWSSYTTAKGSFSATYDVRYTKAAQKSAFRQKNTSTLVIPR